MDLKPIARDLARLWRVWRAYSDKRLIGARETMGAINGLMALRASYRRAG